MNKKILMSTVIISLISICNALAEIKLQPVVKEKTIGIAVALATLPQKPETLFVVEQAGLVRYFDLKAPQNLKTLLDIKTKVDPGGEKGLLGFAFHPDFTKNGFIYVNYISQEKKKLFTNVSRFTVDQKSMMADNKSEKILLKFEQPYENHNGGTVVFGPDNLLYISSGDGGDGGDPHNFGQNKTSMFGKILRLNVDQDNAKPEIYAYGLRNPWKITFDPKTKKLWAADVGQDKWEEINIIEQGKNYGWRLKEGNHCFNPAKKCEKPELVNPVFEYEHKDDNCSITGGFVYYGKRFPNLVGQYIYGDFCTGRIWSFDEMSKKNQLIIDTNLMLTSFGQDNSGEIYVMDLQSGGITSLVP